MADHPKVTVVIPALDPGPSLRRAIDSVLAQTFHEWRAIVIDDGSQEDLDWVAGMDPRIRLVRQPRSGVSSARNRGVDEAESPWIAFLDADDDWRPEKLHRQLALAESRPSVAVHSSFLWITPDDRFESIAPASLSQVDLLRGATVCMSTLLVRRDRFLEIGGLDPTLTHAEDLDLYFRLSRTGSVVAPDGVLANYYTHDAGASMSYWTAYRSRVSVLRRAADRDPDDPAIRDAVTQGIRVARHLAAHQSFDAARRARPDGLRAVAGHLLKTLRVKPLFAIRSVAGWMLVGRRRAG